MITYNFKVTNYKLKWSLTILITFYSFKIIIFYKFVSWWNVLIQNLLLFIHVLFKAYQRAYFALYTQIKTISLPKFVVELKFIWDQLMIIYSYYNFWVAFHCWLALEGLWLGLVLFIWSDWVWFNSNNNVENNK